MALLIKSGYLFGAIKAPSIPGFQVSTKREEWMQAKRGNRNYIVRETDTHFIMERYGPDLWNRDARRNQRYFNRMASEWGGKPMGLKGGWSVDPSEAIAVRKAA